VSNTECKLVDPVTGTSYAVLNRQLSVLDLSFSPFASTVGEAVGLGKRGEIWIRGPQVMKGYYKNEAGEYREMVDKGTRGCC